MGITSNGMELIEHHYQGRAQILFLDIVISSVTLEEPLTMLDRKPSYAYLIK